MTRVPIPSAVAAALLLGSRRRSLRRRRTPRVPQRRQRLKPRPRRPRHRLRSRASSTIPARWGSPRADREDRLLGQLDRSDGKVYCFSSEKSKETFLKNAEANIKKAQDFRAAKASRGGERQDQGFHRGGRERRGEDGDRRAAARTAPSCSAIRSSTPTSTSSSSRSRSCAAWKAMAGSPTSSSTTRTSQEAIRHRLLVQA